ncbi:MAG: esterase-like activity of phytase family protein [Burkholderiales bacterium]|nr:esterase-like activity of phytase family protein [Anaerolineae bacterium]
MRFASLLLTTLAVIGSSVIVLAQDTTEPTLDTYTFEDMPLLATTAGGDDIMLGGFSGLDYLGVNEENGNMMFVTNTDRGPNGEPIDLDGDGNDERPFALPEFQPEIIHFELNPEDGTLTLTERLQMHQADGTPITGLPNLSGTPGMAYADEIPVDLMGTPLEHDPFGGDFEAVLQAEDGTYWIVDEYRPALYHFDADAALIARYVPEGSNATTETGIEALPAIYAQRRGNRGFEAIAEDNGKLYLFIQSPLDNPDVADDQSSKDSRVTRIVEFDPATETTTAEYLYVLDPNTDRLGDAVGIGNGEFLLLDRDDLLPTEEEAFKYIYRINLEGATNLQTIDPSVVIESLTPEELAGAGITPVQSEMLVDLVAIGFDMVTKIEGLTMIDENTLAIVNDNDFGLQGEFDPATGILTENPNPPPMMFGIIHLNGAA